MSVGGDKATKPRNLQDREPCFYHSKPEDLYEEIVHIFGGPKAVRRLVDCTPGQGPLAHFAIRKRLNYFGLDGH